MQISDYNIIKYYNGIRNMNLKCVGVQTLIPVGEKVYFGALKGVLCRKVMTNFFPFTVSLSNVTPF